MTASFESSNKKTAMPPRPTRSEDVMTKGDFFKLTNDIPEDHLYTGLMACKGEESVSGFIEMWMAIFHTSKEEGERIARLVGLEPLTPEQTAMMEDKILGALSKLPKDGHQR